MQKTELQIKIERCSCSSDILEKMGRTSYLTGGFSTEGKGLQKMACTEFVSAFNIQQRPMFIVQRVQLSTLSNDHTWAYTISSFRFAMCL